MRNSSLWSNVVFEKRVIFHLNNKRLQAWSLFVGIWNHTSLCNKGVFFFHYYLATLKTNWVKMFTDLLLCPYFGIHQVRRLVFDNYQRCPVPLFSPTHAVVFINIPVIDELFYRVCVKEFLSWNPDLPIRARQEGL